MYAFFLLFPLFQANEQWVSVSYDGTSYTIHETKNESDMAYARYKDVYSDEGWGRLECYLTSSTYSENSIRALGYAEGYLTHESIYNYFMNMYDFFATLSDSDSINSNATDWINSNREYVENYMQTQDTDFQKHVGMVYTLYLGMIDGYTAAAGSNNISEENFYLLQTFNELDDVIHSFDENITN